MHADGTRRGLLISSPRNGFTCVEPSLERMRDFLARNAFTDLRCIRGDAATRAAIVAGFDALIEATQPGDVVVVYYAGHGSLFSDPDGDLLRAHGYIQPMDLADSDASHFNGLLGAELRLLVRALARLSDNVTAIFDCCHAAGLLADDPTTDANAIAAVAQRAGARIAERRSQARATRSAVARSAGDSGVVRLVASCASERAYARPGTDILLFTDTLVTVLDELAPDYPQSWEQIVRDVRQRVQAVMPEQRPGVEGATARRPFATATLDTPADHFHARRRGELVSLAAGSAAGIEPHESFALLAYAGDATPLTTGIVRRLQPFEAILELSRERRPELPAAMFARRLRKDATIHARLHGPDEPRLTQLHARLAATGLHLRPPVLDHTVPPDHLDLHDLVHVARLSADAPDLLDLLRSALRRIDRWAGLTAQLTAPGLGPLAGCFGLAWHRRRGQESEPLAAGGIVHTGDLVALHLHNLGRASTLHVHVHCAGADRNVEPWSDVDGGHAILGKHHLTLEHTPTLVPGLGERQQQWMIVAIGDGPFDAAPLATPAADRPRYYRDAREATRLEIFGLPYILAAGP